MDFNYVVVCVKNPKSKYFHNIYYCNDIWDLISEIPKGTEYWYYVYDFKTLKILDLIEGWEL